MKKLMMIAAVLFLAVACNKNQKAVKRLDGNWNATEFKTSDGEFTFDLIALGATITMDFDGCKLKDDEFCNMTTTLSFDGDSDTESSVYRVTNDGERLEQKENLADTSVDGIDIIELTKTTLILQQVDGDDVTDITMEKL